MKKWTNADVEYLKDNYGKFSNQRIAKKLNRTVSAICCKANKLGLRFSENDNGLSASYIAEACSVRVHCVYYWIKEKSLPAIKIKNGKSFIYKIRPRDFWKWAKENNSLINMHYIQPNSILPVPKWLRNTIKSTKRQSKRQYRHFSPEEKRIANQMFLSGISVKEIARRLGRSVGSVYKIIEKK